MNPPPATQRYQYVQPTMHRSMLPTFQEQRSDPFHPLYSSTNSSTVLNLQEPSWKRSHTESTKSPKISPVSRKPSSSVSTKSSSSIPYSTNDSKKSKPYMCRCVPESPLKRTVCVGSIAVILLTLSLVAYIFVPKPPTFSVESITLPDSSSNFQISSGLSDINSLSISANLRVSFSFDNPNKFPIKVNQLKLTAQLAPDFNQLQSSPSIQQMINFSETNNKSSAVNNNNMAVVSHDAKEQQAGLGIKSDLELLPKQQTSSDLQLNFNYTPNPSTGLLKDPALAEILQACGVAGQRRPMSLQYTATTNIDIFKQFGYVPSFSNTIQLNCPFDDASVSSIVQTIKSILNLPPGSP
ncbi:hypothetical protein BDV3_003979 [Batrachochytrium dendrobatidis]|nr:hypothetical protein O5D80_001993 [Batrachochytrium dendrobatidis]KAK5669864.1 hypothetical protein QVD99_004240 [Batrachochytrium dendrobatidis]OAJ38418.1 hypothetical protein BDEG_22355 [Batrachochytrium dendrobatidis JEL423]